MAQPLLSAAPSPPLAPRRGASPLPAPSLQYVSSSRTARGPAAAAAARRASTSGGRQMLRSAAVAWSGPQQEERPLEQEAQPLEQEAQLLEQEAQPDQLQVEGGWSEELQREFEAYQAQTPIGERPLLLVISGRSCLLLLCTFVRTLARPCRRSVGLRQPQPWLGLLCRCLPSCTFRQQSSARLRPVAGPSGEAIPFLCLHLLSHCMPAPARIHRATAAGGCCPGLLQDKHVGYASLPRAGGIVRMKVVRFSFPVQAATTPSSWGSSSRMGGTLCCTSLAR